MNKVAVSKIKTYQTAVYKNGHRTFKTSKYKNYEFEIINQLPKINFKHTDEPISLKLDFFFKIPKYTPKKEKSRLNELKTAYYVKYPDYDNATKLIQDILCNFYGIDDRFIAKIEINKFYSKTEDEYFEFHLQKIEEEEE